MLNMPNVKVNKTLCCPSLTCLTDFQHLHAVCLKRTERRNDKVSTYFPDVLSKREKKLPVAMKNQLIFSNCIMNVI